MMLLSYDHISKAAPEIKLIDLDTGEFAYGQASGINSGGKPNVEEAFWSETARKGRARSKGAGSTTLKRAIVLKTILQEQDNDVLEKLAKLTSTGGLG